MEKMSTSQIREKFLEFFKEKDHYIMDSFPLVPKEDKSLLLVNAGMAPLKPFFTGLKVPPSKRVASCQKCIRTGDIDNVGITKRHATFFEMLGNFSFGDYFKEEIIPWSWEFVTEVLNIDKDKLFVTIFFEDDEAFDIWKDKTDIDPNRIFRLGKEDNFWEIGVGPCGPSSEIHYYRGDKDIITVEDFLAASERDEMTEFWNLVFTQFDKDEQGVYHKLNHPNIDTGMGLERMATIMQGVDSIFAIDLMKDIIKEAGQVTGKVYGENEKDDISLRIMADHAKSIAFLIGDGVLPSNEGRGYVLRRLLRRAVRHGKVLGVDRLFLNQIIGVVIEHYQSAYPDLADRKEYIEKIVDLEERKFHETLDSGMLLLKDFMKETKGNIFSGSDAFKLYDTYGFPLELTEEILKESHIDVDVKGFRGEMEDQKNRARNARAGSSYMGSEKKGMDALSENFETVFTGYGKTQTPGIIQAIYQDGGMVETLSAKETGYVILDQSPFYAEMGGQVGDVGIITSVHGKAKVLDTKKSENGNTVHVIQVIEGTLSLGNVTSSVNGNVRKSTERNHTATHLLHKALKMVLGSHVNQAGSLVLPDKLRFDFNHFEAMTSEEILSVENIVNEEILKAIPVNTDVMTMKEAKDTGATALFDEKYGDEVRVLSIGGFSKELCGGTHVTNTGEIGLFKITQETGIASGVRRIEAITGFNSINYMNKEVETLREVQDLLKTSKNEMVPKVKGLLQEVKSLQKQMEDERKAESLSHVDDLLRLKEDVDGVTLVKASVDGLAMGDLRELTEKVLDKLISGVVVLGTVVDDKVNFSIMVSKDLVAKGLHAGKMIKEMATLAGGGGGGRPDMAQAGGKLPEKKDEAMGIVISIVKKQLNS